MHGFRPLGLIACAAALAASPSFSPPAAAQVRVIARGDTSAVQVFSWGGSRLGVSLRDVDKADVDREKLPAPRGAVIDEVRGGSPAEKAGFKAGDVVVEFDGERVRSARHLARLVQETPEGRTVKAVVVRAGKRVELDVTPETGDWPRFTERLERELERLGRELPLRIRPEVERFGWLWVEPFAAGSGGRRRLGVVVQDLPPQLAEYFGVKRGVLVASVTPGSAAEKAGVKAGDVITAIDGAAVDGAADLERRVARLTAGREFSLAVVRDRKSMTLKATIEEPRPSPRRRVVALWSSAAGAPAASWG